MLAKGGKVVVTGLIGGGLFDCRRHVSSKAMTIEGTMTGTLAEARELIDLARAITIDATADRGAAARSGVRALDDLRAGRLSGASSSRPRALPEVRGRNRKDRIDVHA